jgi:hypothetical protein
MRAPPALSPEAVSKALQASFGIRVAGLVFLPVGEDSDSWAYRVEVAPSFQVDAFALMLYPMVDGATGADSRNASSQASSSTWR